MKRVIALLLALVSSSASNAGNVAVADKQWSQLTTWLRNHYSQHLKLLNPPASDDDILQVEARLGHKVPSELVQILKINNGETSSSDGLFGLLRLLPLSEQAQEYERLLLDKSFTPGRYHPFLLGGDGDYHFVDLSNGHIVQWYRGNFEGVRADSLAEFLQKFVLRVQRGDFVVVPDAKGLVDKTDLQ